MRLIDADELDITTIETDDYSGNEILDVILKEDIDDASTILELPNNPSNGDVIKALFPNKASFNGGDGCYFNRDWWNAPYERS